MVNVVSSVVLTRWKAYDALMGFLLFASLVVLYLLSSDVRHFYENAAVENGQLCFLAAALALFCRVAYAQFDEAATAHFIGVSLFVMTVLVREADVRHTWAEPYLGRFFAERLEFVMVGMLWIAWGVFSRRALPSAIRAAFRWMATPAGWALAAGPAFYLAGRLAEKHMFVGDGDMSEILEESFELVGTYFFLLSAYLSTRHMTDARRLGAPESVDASDSEPCTT